MRYGRAWNWNGKIGLIGDGKKDGVVRTLTPEMPVLPRMSVAYK